MFGRRVIVERQGDAWMSFEVGNDGKRRAADFVLPPGLPEDDVEQYLADLFHEAARPGRSNVRQVR